MYAPRSLDGLTLNPASSSREQTRSLLLYLQVPPTRNPANSGASGDGSDPVIELRRAGLPYARIPEVLPCCSIRSLCCVPLLRQYSRPRFAAFAVPSHFLSDS